MEVAVTGGTGTVGRLVVEELARRGHSVRQLSRGTPVVRIAGVVHHSVDLTTGSGLESALRGAEAVVDAANATGTAKRSRELLVGGTERLARAAAAAGVSHHVLCSIVGIDDVPSSYYRAKVEQEQAVTGARTPWSIVRATQFHTLVDGMFSLSARVGLLPAPRFPVQPVDPGVVAVALADAVAAGPSQTRIQVAGPEVVELAELARQWRAARGRRALLVPVPLRGTIGRALRDGGLTAPDAARRDSPTFAQWLGQPSPGSGGARTGARPLPGRRLPGGRLAGRLSVLLADALMRFGAGAVGSSALGAGPYTMLTTFRRDGTPVGVPVWAAMHDGRLYVRSERTAGKVKRLSRDGRAELAPCNAGGRPLGPTVSARGRVLPAEEEAIAERALARHYGRLREAFERNVDRMRVDMCYLELTPEPADRAGAAGSSRPTPS